MLKWCQIHKKGENSMDPIRKAELKDVSRIAEILIFTKRTQ